MLIFILYFWFGLVLSIRYCAHRPPSEGISRWMCVAYMHTQSPSPIRYLFFDTFIVLVSDGMEKAFNN